MFYNGTFTFSVVAQSGGCSSDAATYTVVVREMPDAPQIEITNVQCDPYRVEVSVTNIDSDVVYNWSNGGVGPYTEVTHDGPLQVRAELLGCSVTSQIDLPVDLNSHRWLFPFGCYEFCETEKFEAHILGPLDQMIYWSWLSNFNTLPGTNNGWVEPSPTVDTASYGLQLANEYCNVKFNPSDITVIKDCHGCDMEVDVKNFKCTSISGIPVYEVELIICNASFPGTATITSPKGFFSPSAIPIPMGSTTYNGYFIPDASFTGGSMFFTIELVSNTDADKRCVYLVELNADNCDSAPKTATPKDKVAMAPNPASETATVWYELLHEGDVTLLVTDATGKVLYQMESKTNKGSFIIDVSRLPRGYYPVKLMQNGKIVYSEQLLRN